MILLGGWVEVAVEAGMALQGLGRETQGSHAVKHQSIYSAPFRHREPCLFLPIQMQIILKEAQTKNSPPPEAMNHLLVPA